MLLSGTGPGSEKYKRKDSFSLPNPEHPEGASGLWHRFRKTIKALVSAPQKSRYARTASLTAEAAITLPVFFLCMACVLQLLNVYLCAGKLSASITQTAEEMAIGAYSSEYFEKDTLLGVVLSSAYASGRVHEMAGDISAVKNESFLLSGFLRDGDLIDIVMTWQVRNAVGLVRMPGSVFVQRGAVRGWTGREGSSGETDHDGHEHDHTTVYVAENGTVYHRDSNCTHIRLAIIPTEKEKVKDLRNVYREKYHPCEICGKKASGTVYITTDGNRYHSTLECSGLKRTVHKKELGDVGDLRPCSRCGGKASDH